MKATITTNHGTIVIELNVEKAPSTCANFKRYADEGHYNGTIFHRVIPNFMIQGGGFDADMAQKDTHENIKNEATNGLTNLNGTIAMARTPDPHSASSQFFINLTDNDFLNFRDESQAGFGYCVFGATTEGDEAVAAIAGVQTGSNGGHQDVPVEPVHIESIVVSED
jgi:peptidyl-prolyl cis-trans isomerase B (cyclophilin B)